MSSKHLRRLLEEREKNDGVDYLADEELEQIPTLQSGPSNRFAFFDNDDDSGGDDDVESQESLVASKSSVKNDKRKKKTNKKKKKEKGEGDIDDEKLLEKLVKESVNTSRKRILRDNKRLMRKLDSDISISLTSIRRIVEHELGFYSYKIRRSHMLMEKLKVNRYEKAMKLLCIVWEGRASSMLSTN
uniref:TFIIS N-terminal domain-containing protein n=1 Tax=Heterorhabditis bacteriophora TaxID=37862 RepID=A0A1I7WP23_HETBA